MLRTLKLTLQLRWRLFWNLCPQCNSDGAGLDRCRVCLGSREFPLSEKTKHRDTRRFVMRHNL